VPTICLREPLRLHQRLEITSALELFSQVLGSHFRVPLLVQRSVTNQLSAVAISASYLDSGDHPSSRLAFSLVAFLTTPSSNRISLAAGSFSAAKRTIQFGNARKRTLAAYWSMRLFRDAGPKTPTGLITESSRFPPSRAIKSHAARPASILDLTQAVRLPVGSVQLVSL
jgi:hypothetical protein